MPAKPIPNDKTPNPLKRATSWKIKRGWIDCSAGPIVMGIVNVTPDSFSDGGRFLGPENCEATSVSLAIDHAMKLVQQGAGILDIGGESTRPYAAPVELQQELDRTIPVIQGLANRTDIPLSIDTSKSAVAREALQSGAHIINDITGLEGDEEMAAVAIDTDAGVCAMHMQGTPQDMQDDPTYQDVVQETIHYLRQCKNRLEGQGVKSENICLDPGLGFGKSHQHNWQIIRQIRQYHDLHCPILVGHSRKGFIGELLGDKKIERDSATAGIATWLASCGIQIIRVHNVSSTVRALSAFKMASGLQ